MRIFLLLLCSALFAEPFPEWWRSYKTSHQVPPDLALMEDYYANSNLFLFSSELWENLNKLNIDQIASAGFLNFKQTVACNYFTFVSPIDSLYSSNLKEYPLAAAAYGLEKKHELFSFEDSVRYNTVTAKLLQYAIDSGLESYFDFLEEPALGNPPCISYRGKRISQDLINSLIEYTAIAAPIGDFSSVLEVGAGSGRTAYCFLKCRPHLKYMIVDLPPALYLSQTYLSSVFPEKKIFRFRPFESFEEIEKEWRAADLSFFTPDQMKFLPKDSIDLFLAIDCLHEMKPEAIQFFIDEASRLARYFYLKNWNFTVVDEKYSYSWLTYPIPRAWAELFDEPCFIPAAFYHSLYKIK